MKVEVLELAKQEFDEAFSYYEAKELGLGTKFQYAIKAQLQAITNHPDAWLLIRPGIRKCLGQRFLDLIYEIHPSRIVILAVAHEAPSMTECGTARWAAPKKKSSRLE